MNIPVQANVTNLAWKIASGPAANNDLGAAMHIPDGFMSPVVSIIFWLISAAVVGYALWRVNKEMDERKVPLMGVLAAAIFAGQMLNFAVTGGTSGHLMGAALATILLGPWASIVVMTAVVSIQALLFQDGGMLALGTNIFNMAVIGTFVSYALYELLHRLLNKQKWGLYISGFVAAWTSIVIAALVVALQLALSSTSPINLALPAMGGIHAIIGLGEGLITVGALAFITATRPDLVSAEAKTAQGGMQRGVVIVGLLLAIGLAVISPIASGNPDGLEWVAEELNFLDTAQDPLYNVIPDYVFPGISNEAVATIIAGIVGAIIVFGVVILSNQLRKKQSAS